MREVCDRKCTQLQVGVFDGDDDDGGDDGNVAAVLMKAGILSILEGILKKQEKVGRKGAALLKTHAGRLANMILHPNVQLRDRTIAVVELVLSGAANKDVRRAFAEEPALDRIKANLAEVLRHADAISAASLVTPLATATRAGGAGNALRLTKKLLKVFYEEKRTDAKCELRRAAVAAWMADTAEFIAPDPDLLQLFLETAAKNESTESLTESCEAIRSAAKKALGLEGYAVATKSLAKAARLSGGAKRRLVVETASGKRVRVDG